MFKTVLKTFQGIVWWREISHQYKLKRTDYVVVLGKDYALNQEVVNCLPNFIKKKYANRVLIIGSDLMNYRMSDDKLVLIEYTEGKVEALLQYYKFNEFWGIIISSLDEPFGSYGLLEKRTINLKDIVENYILC